MVYNFIYLSKINTNMKTKNLVLIGATALFIASCSSSADSAEASEETSDAVVYTLDAEASSLWWKGEENENHFHTGNVQITDGSLTMIGGSVSEGTFTIDLTKITVADPMPEDKINYLISHLQDTSFFFTAQYPTANVTVNSYNDGKMNATINVLGTDLTNDIPLAMNTTEEGATFNGKFSVDFADTKMPYITEVDPKTGEPGAKSVFQFDLNLVLKK